MKDNVFELLTIGRVGVDLYPSEIGLPLSKVKSFDKFLAALSAGLLRRRMRR